MNKRRNDTHKLEATDEKEAREPKLLPDQELEAVSGGVTQTLNYQEIIGDLGDQVIILIYDDVPWVKYELEGPCWIADSMVVLAVYQCTLCSQQIDLSDYSTNDAYKALNMHVMECHQ
ncbi:MAG: hypothetical protein LBJ95_04135 [Oscillospiraceae bacterium]|jgi:hypothetical protein|nr:hypothetical protein [Oscillospiraceae bacterium]